MTKTEQEKIAAIAHRLASLGPSRPRKVKTLTSSINALFNKALEEPELSRLVAALKKNGLINLDGDSVTYNIPSPPRQGDGEGKEQR